MDSFKYFENKKCQYFPCHKSGKVNCLFCFCPLYYFECPGNYSILPNGIKDCSNCDFPHQEENYDIIMELIKRNTSKVYSNENGGKL